MRLSIILALLALAVASRARGQERLHVDLSGKAQDTVAISPGSYRIVLVNRLPASEYFVEVFDRRLEIPPLAPPGGTQQLRTEQRCSDAADRLVRVALDSLLRETSEGSIPRLKRQLAIALVHADCPSSTVTQAQAAQQATTDASTQPVSVKAGHYLTVAVTRGALGGQPAPMWTRIFTTGATRQWRVTYGFAFPFAGVGRGVFGGAEQYFTRAENGGYVVARAARTHYLDAVPTVLYNFFPADAGDWHWERLTAGLGVDLDEPMITLGSGATYGSNVMLSAGIAARHVRVLAGAFSEDLTLKESLTWDQLSESAMRLRPYVALTLRFGANPFARPKEEPAPKEQVAPRVTAMP